MDLKERIESAIISGEILEIKYYGGSTPGMKRNIAPVKIEGDKVIARCLISNVVKSFSLQKISFLDGKESYEISKDVIEKLNRKSIKSINELYKGHKTFLEGLGWYVTLDNSDCISLRSYFKNGNPKKSFDISISFDEFTEQYIYDIAKEDIVIEKLKKQKPWCVMAKGETTRNYESLSNCIETFLEFSKKLAPNKNS